MQKFIFFIILFLTTFIFGQSLKISQFPPVSNTALVSGNQFVLAASGTTKSLTLGELDKRWSWTASSPLLKTGSENSILSLPSANAGTNGYLLATDWIDFSSKLSPSGAATITNKDIDGGTASNSNRITLPKNTKSNLDTLARKEGTLVYDTTGAKVYYDDGSTLKPVGSGTGGAKNYVNGGDAESGLSGFLVSKNTSASAIPDPGFVTTGTTITFAASSTAPLADSNSFLLTKTAANSQGQQVYVPFTIDASAKAKVLQISFDYLVNSGTFAAGTSTTDSDVTVWIYDVTNNAFIQPSSYRLLSNSASISDRFTANFQTASNSTSYRLLFHVATTSASAFQLKLDGISVSPSVYTYGTPITDWQPYTPTFTSFGTATSINFLWRRVGSSIEVKGNFVAGTTVASEARISLPAGYSTVSTLPTISLAGKLTRGNTAASNVKDFDVLVEPSVSYFTFGINEYSTALPSLAKRNGDGVGVSGETFSLFASVPIQGLSSSVQMSDQADTRLVSFTGNKSSGQAVTAVTTDITYTATKDSHNAWNGTQYLVTSPGDYYVSTTASASGNGEIAAYVNGVSTNRMVGAMNPTTWTGAGNVVPNLKTGDLISFRSTSSVTITGSATQNNISIFKLSGNTTIAASELVSLRYTNSAGTAIGTSSTLIPYATKSFDSHGAWNSATSTFTAPIAGKYLVRAKWAPGAVTNTNGYTFIYKNGVQYSVNYINGASNSNSSIECSDVVDLLAGETIQIYGQYGSAVNMNASAVYNTLSILRIGF